MGPEDVELKGKEICSEIENSTLLKDVAEEDGVKTPQ